MNLAEALHTEIQFWEGMLNSQADETDPEIVHRIKMAKLLAEQKLSLYSIECTNEIN